MFKRFELGKVDFNEVGRKNHMADIEVELRTNSKDQLVFSVCGYIWNTKHTDIVCGGQCLDTINEYKKSFNKENRELFEKVYRLWKLYHLNDMHSGTLEQENAIKEWEKQGNKYEYSKVCDYLKSIGLYEVEYEGKPYRYGSGWLYQPIPEDDLNIIKELLA